MKFRSKNLMHRQGMQGSIDAALMLGLTLLLNFGLYTLSLRLAAQFTVAYDSLQPKAGTLDEAPEPIEFFGKSKLALPPLIDFAAHHRPMEDAEALCYIVTNFGCAAPGTNFQCY